MLSQFTTIGDIWLAPGASNYMNRRGWPIICKMTHQHTHITTYGLHKHPPTFIYKYFLVLVLLSLQSDATYSFTHKQITFLFGGCTERRHSYGAIITTRGLVQAVTNAETRLWASPLRYFVIQFCLFHVQFNKQTLPERRHDIVITFSAAWKHMH